MLGAQGKGGCGQTGQEQEKMKVGNAVGGRMEGGGMSHWILCYLTDTLNLTFI